MERCSICGIKCEPVVRTDGREKPRCGLCASHFDLRRRYKSVYYKDRSKELTRLALKEPKKSKHCPTCHHFRHRAAFLKFNDPFAECSLCREEKMDAAMAARNEDRRKRRIAAYVQTRLAVLRQGGKHDDEEV